MMMERKKPLWLPIMISALSAAAYGLRKALYMTALDEKNLLIAGHPLEIALWTVVLTGAALIVATVRKLDGSNVYEDNFRASAPAALGYFLLAYVIGMMVLLNDFAGPDRIALLLRILGGVTVPGLIWGGVSRIRGKRPFFLVHGALTVFLLLHLVSRYPLWSGNPQLQDYVFDLLAAVALLLFGYHCAALEAGLGKRRMQLRMGLLAVLLCGGALAGSETPGLFAAGMVWALTDLCSLAPPPEKEEVDAHDPA